MARAAWPPKNGFAKTYCGIADIEIGGGIEVRGQAPGEVGGNPTERDLARAKATSPPVETDVW